MLVWVRQRRVAGMVMTFLMLMRDVVLRTCKVDLLFMSVRLRDMEAYIKLRMEVKVCEQEGVEGGETNETDDREKGKWAEREKEREEEREKRATCIDTTILNKYLIQRLNLYPHACAHAYVCILVCVSTTCICVCVSLRVHACVSVCVCAFVCV